MKLVIETDLGRDPDDLFAILYLISAGVDINRDHLWDYLWKGV